MKFLISLAMMWAYGMTFFIGGWMAWNGLNLIDRRHRRQEEATRKNLGEG